MKKLFLSLVALMVATMSFAQSSMLATLSHDGNISTFYGATALRDAHNSASDGDVITLSGGTFIGVDIKKALTIRGAGMAFDSLSLSEPTVITNNFTIEIPDSVTSRLTIEGIFHNHTLYYKGTLKGATFMKSRFSSITYSSSDSKIVNLTMLHSNVSVGLALSSNSNAVCINSVICQPRSVDKTNSNFEFANCILYYTVSSNQVIYNDGYNNYALLIFSSTMKNCYIQINNSYTSYLYLHSSNTVFNCLSNYSIIFNKLPSYNNKIVANKNFFKSSCEYYSDVLTFELSDTAKETYKGTDGTEVGIYGGNMPFSTVTTNPQITKCNVAAKSTADGKLSVDIEVNGGE